jgi:hypothetical protein
VSGSARRKYPNSYFSWETISELQSFHYVQTHKFARHADSSHLRPFGAQAAMAFTSAHIAVGYLPRAADMLTAQNRAIGGKETRTLQK